MSKFRTCVFTVLIVLLAACSVSEIRSQTAQEQPRVVSAAAPIFPPIALAARAIGEVNVEVSVDAGGAVTKVHTEGHPLLQRSCESAAKRWRFAPSETNSLTRTARLTFVFKVTEKNLPEAEITPEFLPPYKVIVTRNIPHLDAARSY